jgi:hypothetical protein
MDKNGRNQRNDGDRSFANGNMGPGDGPQLEGWLIHPAHWWFWA